MSTFTDSIYKTFFRRNPIFLGTVFVTAFGMEILFDQGGNSVWDYINKGRQWKDIKSRYVQKDDGDD